MPKPSVRVRLRRRWGTIGAHLVVLVAVQLVLVTGLIAYAGFQDMRSARAEAVGKADTIAHVAANKISDQLKASATEMGQVAQFSSIFKSPGFCALLQSDGLQDPTQFRNRSMLLHLDGRAVCAGQVGFPGAAWVPRVARSTGVVSAGPVAGSTGKYLLIYAARVPGMDMIAGFAIDLSTIAGALDKQLALGSAPIDFLLTSTDRSVALSSTDEGSGQRLAGTPYSRPIAKGHETFGDLGGEQRTYAEAAVPGAGWHLYTGYRTANALSAARAALRERIVLAFLMVVVVVAIAIVIQRRFVRPIRSLSKVTKRIAEGELGATVRPSGPVELVALGQSFNTMIGVRKRSEAALRKAFAAEKRATEELREIDKIRNTFLMAISHELCTPLTSVVGFASFLNDNRDVVSQAEKDQGIEAIASQSKRLESLLLDLLDVERLTRGAIEPHIVETDVRELVKHVVKRASVSRKIATDIRGAIRASVDPALVERMVENLVVNAVKYTPPGTKIWVRAARRNGDLRLVVEDAGEGVPDELKLAIFEPFVQGTVQTHSPGTGVGLSLVSQFAKLHGGRAWVEDRPGGGASFHIDIPATNGAHRGRRAHAGTKS